MGRLSWPIMIAGSMLAVAAAPPTVPLRDGTGQAAGVSGPAVVLFWAAWCAPCRAEVANYEALQRSAAPMRLLVVATDASRKSRELLHAVPADELRFPASPSADVMTMLGELGSGLPAALAIDADGQICAAHQGGVRPEDLAAWRKKCLRGD